MLTRQPMPAAGAGNGQAPYMAPGPMGGEIVKLSRPIEGHKGPISDIRLREPTAGDWVACGELARTFVLQAPNGEQKMELQHEPARYMAWMERLSGLDSSVLGRMPMDDMRRVIEALRRLVSPDAPGNSATSSPSSG